MLQAAFNPQGTVFYCYGDTIYSPSGADVPEDIILHETIHSKRQGTDPNGWWMRYIQDSAFRLEEELLAYAHQLNFVKQHMGNRAAEDCLFEIAQGLTMNYNLSMTHAQAESAVRSKAKTL